MTQIEGGCFLRKLMLIGLVLLLAGVVRAADVSVGELEFGIKGGMNLSDARGTDKDDASTRTGFIAGAYGTLRVHRLFVVQLEALYTRKGFDNFNVEQGFYGIYDAILTCDYVEVPLLLKVSIPTAGTVLPNFYVGPALAFSTRSKLSVQEPRDEFGNPLPAWNADIVNVKSTYFELVLGTGAEMEYPGWKVLLDVRYTWGMSHFTNDHEFVLTNSEVALVKADGSGLDVRHGTLSVIVGMAF